MPKIPPHLVLVTGVYLIRNLVNGKVYVGSAAKSFTNRKDRHFYLLNRGIHHNRHLQSSWKLYGIQSFSFEIKERCKPEDCLSREQFWIDTLKATDFNFGYNICPTAGSALGRKMSEEFCRALSKRNKGRKTSIVSRLKMSLMRKGKFSPLQAASIKKAHEAWRGKKHSPESISKMSTKKLGKVATEETRRRISEAVKKQWEMKEDRTMPAAQALAIKLARSTPESRKRTSEASKKSWAERKRKNAENSTD